MWEVLAVLISLLVCLLVHLHKSFQSQKLYPPGPLWLPLIGNVWAFPFTGSQQPFVQLAKRYGNVCTLWLGSKRVVLLSGFQAVKEGLIMHSEDMADRGVSPYIKAITKEREHSLNVDRYSNVLLNTSSDDCSTLNQNNEQGVIYSNGHAWKQHRKFAVVTLRKLGLGNKGLEYQVEAEACQLVKTLALAKAIADMCSVPLHISMGLIYVLWAAKSILAYSKPQVSYVLMTSETRILTISFIDTLLGQPLDPALPIRKSVANVICALAFGLSFSVEDKEFLQMLEASQFILENSAGFNYILFEFFPGLMKHLPGCHRKAISCSEAVISFAKKKIEEHKMYWATHEPQDFIDFYMLQMEKSKKDPDSTYNEENLASCILDLFMAGSDTTASTLQWALLLMANHPDIQEKVHKEIEDVLSSVQSFSYQDVKKLPYTNAVIHEIQRSQYIFFYGVGRKCVKDVKMFGFLIPKETFVLPDLRSVLCDPTQWETAEAFNPNHFLDKDGNFVDREEFLPFGAGARVCLGEQLARIELFIFFTSLLRAFTFQLPEGVKELSRKFKTGFTTPPHPYQLCAVPRCSAA